MFFLAEGLYRLPEVEFDEEYGKFKYSRVWMEKFQTPCVVDCRGAVHCSLEKGVFVVHTISWSPEEVDVIFVPFSTLQGASVKLENGIGKRQGDLPFRQ